MWDTTEKYLRMAIKCFSVVSHNPGVFLPLYHTTTESCSVYCIPQYNTEELWDPAQKNLPQCIPQSHRFSSGVSHNGRYFPPLWDTTEKFFSIVVYNGRGFPPLWDTTEEGFFVVGYNGRSFFHCGIQWRKIIQCRMIFSNFKCLSVLSNRNLGKISYLNSQTNLWKKFKMENYMVQHEHFFSIVGYTAAEIFSIFKLK